MGREADAITLLKDHVAAHPDSIGGHYQLGQVSEKIGDIPSAKAAYNWFVDKPQDFLDRWLLHERTGPFEHADDVTTLGRALDRWAALNEKYRNDPQMDKTILNMFVRAYDVIDREYWPAHVAAGEYFMSHDQAQEAAKEFTVALKANPNDIRALQGMGHIALQHFSFEGVEQAMHDIRAVNPNSRVADLLEARDMLLQRRPELAFAPVRRVLDAEPKNIEALGLLAATYGLQLKDAKTAEVLHASRSDRPA